MAKQKDDRRFNDIEAHDKILRELKSGNDKLLVIDERQQVVLKRLDNINGAVEDYRSNKYKMSNNENDIVTICDRLIKHDDEHKIFDEKYIGKKLFTTLTIILGLLIIVSNILNYYGV